MRAGQVWAKSAALPAHQQEPAFGHVTRQTRSGRVTVAQIIARVCKPGPQHHIELSQQNKTADNR